MSQTRTFEAEAGGWLTMLLFKRGLYSYAKSAGVRVAYSTHAGTLRITLTGNVDALDDLVWTLRDEFGERLREVRG